MKTRITSFHTKPRKQMKRSPIRKVGKVGRANIEANRRLKVALEGRVDMCEIRLADCLVTWPLQFCHRHKRAWYRGDVAKLSAYSQVIVGCQNCHEKIEHDEELTEAVFNRLRGDE